MTASKDESFQIVGTGPGLSARIQLVLLRSVAAVDRLLGGRGLGFLVPLLSRIFPSGNHLVGFVHGRPLKVRMADAYWITPLLRTGVYEPEVGGVLRRVLRQDSAFVDCGANIGYWSVLAAHLIGLPGRVVAAEASPYTATLLRENCRLNEGAIEAVQSAVWSTSGDTIALAVDEDRHSWASGEPHVVEDLKRMGFSTAQVSTITIDDLALKLGNPAVFVVKIDVEGSEESAIRGASQTLQRDALFIYEEHGRSEFPVVTSLMMEKGMEVFALTSDGTSQQVHSPEEVLSRTTDRSRGYNLCAARAGTEAHSRLTSSIREIG